MSKKALSIDKPKQEKAEQRHNTAQCFPGYNILLFSSKIDFVTCRFSVLGRTEKIRTGFVLYTVHVYERPPRHGC